MIESLTELESELSKQSGILFLAEVLPEIYRMQGNASQSELKALSQHSPHHYLYYRRYPRPQSDPLKLGRAIHTALLEPHLYEKRYMEAPLINKRTKDGKKLSGEIMEIAHEEGKEILSKTDYHLPLEMRENIKANQPHIAELIHSGLSERSCFGFIDGAPAKCQLDYYRPGPHQILEFKSTLSANPVSFEREIRKFRYHWQAAWYIDLVKGITGEEPGFTFVALEKTPPYGGALYTLKFDLLAIARREIHEALEVWKRCKEKNHWPSYPAEPYQVGAHEWEWKNYKNWLHMKNIGSIR